MSWANHNVRWRCQWANHDIIIMSGGRISGGRLSGRLVKSVKKSYHRLHLMLRSIGHL